MSFGFIEKSFCTSPNSQNLYSFRVLTVEKQYLITEEAVLEKVLTSRGSLRDWSSIFKTVVIIRNRLDSKFVSDLAYIAIINVVSTPTSIRSNRVQTVAVEIPFQQLYLIGLTIFLLTVLRTSENRALGTSRVLLQYFI